MKPDNSSWTLLRRPGAMLLFNQLVTCRAYDDIMIVMFGSELSALGTWFFSGFRRKLDYIKSTRAGKDRSSSSKLHDQGPIDYSTLMVRMYQTHGT